MDIEQNDKSGYVDFFLTPEEVYQCYQTAFPQSKDKEWELDQFGDIDLYGQGLTDSSAMLGCVGEFCVAKYLNCKENKKVLKRGDGGKDFKFVVSKKIVGEKSKEIGDIVSIDVKTEYKVYRYDPGYMGEINLENEEKFFLSKDNLRSDISVWCVINKKQCQINGCLKRTINKDDTWLNNWCLRVFGFITQRQIGLYENNKFISWVDKKTRNFYVKKVDLKPINLLRQYKNMYFPIQKED